MRFLLYHSGFMDIPRPESSPRPPHRLTQQAERLFAEHFSVHAGGLGDALAGAVTGEPAADNPDAELLELAHAETLAACGLTIDRSDLSTGRMLVTDGSLLASALDTISQDGHNATIAEGMTAIVGGTLGDLQQNIAAAHEAQVAKAVRTGTPGMVERTSWT